MRNIINKKLAITLTGLAIGIGCLTSQASAGSNDAYGQVCNSTQQSLGLIFSNPNGGGASGSFIHIDGHGNNYSFTLSAGECKEIHMYESNFGNSGQGEVAFSSDSHQYISFNSLNVGSDSPSIELESGAKYAYSNGKPMSDGQNINFTKNESDINSPNYTLYIGESPSSTENNIHILP